MLNEKKVWIREVTEHPSDETKVVVKTREEKSDSRAAANMGSSNVYTFEGEASDDYKIGEELTITVERA